MNIKVAQPKMGRPIAKALKPVLGRDLINIGFGVGRLRPVGSREIRTEARQISLIIMAANGMSAHQI